MAKIINISKVTQAITDLSISLDPGQSTHKADALVEASADAREFILPNNFMQIIWDKSSQVARDEFEINTVADIQDPTTAVATHSAKTTGVHGVGSETVGIKDKDTYLDKGGTNEVTAANAKDAVSKKHSQGTDVGLDTGGSNPVTAANIKIALDTTIPAKLDASKLVAVESGVSTGGGGATEVLTVTNLAAGDTILSVVNSTAGTTPANCIVIAFSYSAPGQLSVTWIGDPGAGAKVTVCLKKA